MNGTQVNRKDVSESPSSLLYGFLRDPLRKIEIEREKWDQAALQL